ncbi:MAG: DRTGG domain-containing protein, partial [Cyanobacteria bacterium P01_H01_bin.15]
RNLAIVTGSDRTELQLAALETSAHCLILTGNMPPQSLILNRAEDLEIPILSVHLDTLTTVEIIEQAFGEVRLTEPIKATRAQALMSQYFDFNNFFNRLGLQPPIPA